MHQGVPLCSLLLRESWRSYVCKKTENHPHWICKTATLSTSSHPPSRGVLSEAFIPIALVPVCVPKKASSRKEMPTPGLTSFSPALSHRSCLRKWSLGFVALWSLSLQKQQRAPLRVSCSWKLRMEFLSVHLWLVIGLF